MPEQEFEIYLSLLSRLLRLSPAQKAAISDELRDHLEQRLADLLQSGKSREEAIIIAMEEFGDVTGLAFDLTTVSRTPLKKVVVGSTIVASVTAALIVCWITLFVPEHRIAAPVAVQAQQDEPSSDAATRSVAKKDLKKSNAAPEKPSFLEDAELFPPFLALETEVNFEETPLLEACNYLQDLHQVPVMMYRSTLQDAGIGIDHPVTLRLQGLTYEEVLNHLSRQLSLAWQVEGGIVRITTRESASESAHLMTRNFDLRKLTRQGHSLSVLLDVLQLVATNWAYDNNGEGTVALIGESVVVRQTYQNLRRIALVLAAIEQEKSMVVLETCTKRSRLIAALKEPTEVRFADNPLVDVVGYLGDLHHIAFVIDKQALEDDGVDLDQPFTLSLTNHPLGQVLKLLLSESGLTYQIHDGVIRITTISRAAEDMEWVVYNVKDLAPTEQLRSQLSDAIYQSTSGMWEVTDNEGGALVQTNIGGSLLVKQTDQVQFEIQALLEQLRQSGTEDQAAAPDNQALQAKLVTKCYRMHTEVAADLSNVLQDLVAPESWGKTDGETPSIHIVTSVPQMDQVDGLVTGGTHEVQTINPPREKQKEGRPPEEPAPVKSIVVRPRSILIIRQSPQVHREIQKLLQKLGIQVEKGDLESDGIGLPGFMGGGGGGFGGGGGMGGGGFF